MSGQLDRDTELTPEGAAVLSAILDDTKRLRELDLADAAPAAAFQADWE